MGGLFPKMKITALTMLMGCFAIAGIPLFSGWYSKDAILANALGFVSIYPHHFMLFLVPLVTAGLTTFYMFRMWFLTFTGKPRDHHVHENAHETPWRLTVPLILLAFFSVTVGWAKPDFETMSWPIYNPETSWLGHQLEHAQPASVEADFGPAHAGHGDVHPAAHAIDHEVEVKEAKDTHPNTVMAKAHEYHALAGYIALGLVILGLSFALLVYYFRVLDPHEAKVQFPGVHDFLANKWYFDQLYSVILVRPSLAVAGWARNFDSKVIDGLVHLIARIGVFGSWLSGLFDRYLVDGLVNLSATVSYGIGGWLRGFQTGYLRSYVLFLVLAAVGIWLALRMVLS